MARKVNAFQSSDGLLFETREQAEQHEATLRTKFKNVHVFEVFGHPDLNKGTAGAHFLGHLLVHANTHHTWFAEDWAYKRFGNRIEFVQGDFASHAIREHWMVRPITLLPEQVNPKDILDWVEENTVKKIWTRDGGKAT